MIRNARNLLLAAVLALPSLVHGQAVAVQRDTLGFSARVADQGQPVTGTHSFVFSFWKVASGGNATLGTGDKLWTETQSLAVTDGVVVAVLGADATTPNPFPVALFDGSDRWLEVSMDGVAFGPRMGVRAVPYAMRAAEADHAATATNAANATNAGTAATATGLTCSGACVQDAEIESVSGAKVVGAVASAVSANTAAVATSMAVAVDCTTVAGPEFSLPASGGMCPLRSPCFCVIGQYCPCDECISSSCPAGYQMTGGGYWAGNSTQAFNVLSSIPYGSDRWKLRVVNNAATTLLISPYVRCCRVP